MESQSGVIIRPGLMILFVTLDKCAMPKDHEYEGAFSSPTDFSVAEPEPHQEG